MSTSSDYAGKDRKRPNFESVEELGFKMGVSKNRIGPAKARLAEFGYLTLEPVRLATGGATHKVWVEPLWERNQAWVERKRMEVRELLACYGARHLKSRKKPFVIVEGKDHRLAKRLTETFTEQVLKGMVDSFFSFSREDDSFAAFYVQRDALAADAREGMRHDARKP